MSKTIFWSSLIAIFFSASIPLHAKAPAAAPVSNEDLSAYESMAGFARALQLVRQDYVDKNKIAYRDLIYAAMRGMLSSLDPHSQFMDPEDYQSMQEETNGKFEGVGVSLAVKGGNLVIISPMEGSPAFNAGLMPGDEILKIDGMATDKVDPAEAARKLRGVPGSKVTITVLRPATKQIKEVTIRRAIIDLPTVTDAKLLPVSLTENFKIGYVRITQFNEPTAAELAKQLNSLEAKGMQALIIDLRYNPGGLLTSAVGVCAQFLGPNQLVVSTEGRVASQQRTYKTAANHIEQRKYPLAILVNYGSASGAEIVAGALKDLKRAVLVGVTTFGKGSVQSVIPLDDGSALRFTTARYFTPSRQMINEHGVTPNIIVPMSSKQEQLLWLKRRRPALTPQQKARLANFQDPQLDRAVDALKGDLIYANRSAQTVAASSKKATK